MKHTSFTKEAAKIHLSARERRDLRERLVSYMEYHPLRMPQPQRVKPARSFVHFGAYLVRMRPLVGAVALLFFIVVPVAAERALPGDTLYAIKVGVNEELRGQFAFSPYEKMLWETERVERRVAEARVLASEGRLTEANEDVLEARVRSHTEAFQGQLAELRTTDAEGAAIAEVTLESALDVQSVVLDSETAARALSAEVGTGNVAGIADIVREARSDVASSTKTGTQPSYARMAARVDEDTTRIHALATSIENQLTDAHRAEFDARMTRVEEDIAAAAAAHEAGNDTEAVETLISVLATTQKLVAFLSNFDLRSQVSLNRLVPPRLTEEELVADLTERIEMLRTREEELAEQGAALAEPLRTEVGEKLAALTQTREDASEALEAGTLVDAQTIVIEAEVRATDLAVLIAGGESEDEAPDEEPDDILPVVVPE